MGKNKFIYIQAEGVSVEFKDRHIFSAKEFSLYQGDRVGLVGRNGAGKTTFLNLLYGEVVPDTGVVRRNGTISYFRQFDEIPSMNQEGSRLKKEFQVKELANATKVSGGENTRIRLADVLNGEADVLFVDEPTSNLDIKGITLLREKIESVDTFILISHDRTLLSSVCNRIVEIENEEVTVYEMGYEKYLEVKAEDRKRRQREYEAYVEEKNHLQTVYQAKKQKAKEIGKQPRKISPRDARLRNFLASRPYDCKQLAMERQAKAVQSRLEHLEVKEKPKELPGIQLDFALTNPPENRRVIKAEELSCSYGKKEVLQDVRFAIKNGEKVAIVGENGAGKTTLLNAIITRQEGIYVVPKARLGYFRQQFEQLDSEKSVLLNIMKDSIQKEEVARTILARLLLGAEFIHERVGKLSGGERVKLAIAKLLVSDANVLLLDEPTNYLDLPSVEALTEVLKEYEGTILFVSHDEALINELADGLLVIRDKKIEAFQGNLSKYKERAKNKSTAKDERVHMEIQMLEMRLVELISRISVEQGKQELEDEYEQTIKRLSVLRGQKRS